MSGKHLKNNIGDVYGKLTILSERGFRKDSHGNNFHYVWVKCMCGVEKEVNLYQIRCGRVKSCGCAARRKPEYMNRLHPLYKVFKSMKGRYFISHIFMVMCNGSNFSLRTYCKLLCIY